jgi:hypothetical protein
LMVNLRLRRRVSFALVAGAPVALVTPCIVTPPRRGDGSLS